MNSGPTKPSIVFFGTGPVASASLELLVHHVGIEAVVTKPAPLHHRQPAPVLETAQRLGLPVVLASSKTELDQVVRQANFTSRLAVLIDFGIIVSRRVIDSFELGIINSHFSLLPLLRGADPISFAILEGHSKTGVSLMLIDEGMDTGQLIARRELSLDGSETTPTLTADLISLSDEMLQAALPRYLAGNIKPQPQAGQPSYSRKLTKADGVIDLSKSAQQLEQQIRAFKDWPQSRTKIGSIEVIITKAHVSAIATELSLQAGDQQYLAIDSLKPLGKKEMPTRAFLSGYKNKI